MSSPTLKSFNIPEGRVIKVLVDGVPLWDGLDEPTEPVQKFNYVSFGDSIAVGHRIDDNWEKNYGWNAQYGVEGRTQTTLVTGCYTDIIRQKLESIYDANNISVTSFARSGDKVSDLMNKLTHTTVQNALKNADLATICIGANDVLTYALFGLSNYLTTGDLSTIDAQVNASLAVLNDDSASTSYWALLNRLKSVNPNTKYVFTTIYNPYKYLWIDGSTDGFFEPMLDYIKIDPILGIDVGEIIKQNIMNTSELTTFISRINTIHEKAEEYVTRLNTILRNKITAFQASNPNFILADTKSLFDSVPDRQGAGQLHYNDLVNVEYTRGFNTADIRWYPLWIDEYGENYQQYWTDLATRHVSLEKGFDIMGFARDLVPQIAEKVIEPNVDPHPEKDGHYVMYRSFADTLDWESLNTITYNANGGKGSMETQKVLDYAIVDGGSKKVYSIINANAFNPQEHYHFTSWKADNGNSYSDKEAIYVPTNIVLSAQWGINTHTLTVVQGTPDAASLATLYVRDYSNRQLYIGGYSRYLNSDKTTWDLPLKDTQTFEVAYGLPIKMVVTGNVEWLTDIHLGEAPRPNCSISQLVGGTTYEPKVTAKVAEANFTMPDEDITIEYHFNYRANAASVYPSPYSHSYWLGYIGEKDLGVSYSGSNN